MSDKAIEKIQKHLTSPETLAKFTNILSERARPYIQSVLTAVEAADGLQKCTPESIGIAAMRAAQLELSCDPAVRQAHLVPYKRNKNVDGKWVSYYEAVFQPHYNGIYTLAMRTKKYRKIEVIPTPAGYSLQHDIANGEDVLLNEKGKPVAFMPKVDPKEAGGWYGYFYTTYGFCKKIFMTVEEIHEHAQKFSKAYNAKNQKGEYTSLWHDPTHKPTMEMKTVLLELMRWADLSGLGGSLLREAIQASDMIIDAEAQDIQGGEELPAGDPIDQEPGQDDKTEEGDIELIDPLGEWAVKYAAKEWNIETGQAAKSIGDKKLGNRMDKRDFIEMVTGDKPKPAPKKKGKTG